MIKRQRVVISTNGRNLKIPRCARNDRGCGRNDMRGGTDKKQRGFSLVSAIFLLVVIAALGTFAVTLFTTQQQSAAMDVLGSRAYQAARAGIEWGEYQAIINNGAGINCAALPAITANGPIAMANTLQNFTVTVNCGSAAYSEAGNTVTMYQLTSTATQGTVATPNYVERQMSVTIAH
jgi:MSHA biogenesis protein MshP